MKPCSFLAKKPLHTAVSLILLHASSSAFATTPLAAIVVTANRTAESADTLSVNISSAAKEQIQLDQGQHIQDSTRMMAGVTINQLSNSSSHNTGIRMPLNYDGYYLFLQDNIPLQSSAFFNHNGLRWSSYNTQADQIEVLKGAGTTLYGSGAVAATVNVLSANPQFAPEGSASFTAGADDHLQLKFTHTDAINDNQALLFAASALQDNGWREQSGRERQEVLLKHLWLLDDDNELITQLQASTLTDEMATSLSETAYQNTPQDSGLSPAVAALNPERDSDYLRLSTQWTHRINDSAELSFIPYVRHSTNDYIATWNSYTPKAESSVDTLGLLSKLTLQHENGSETVLGMDAEYSQSDSFSFQPLDVTASSWGGGSTTYVKGFVYQDNEILFQNLSPYLQHTYPLTDKLQLQAGVRYDFSRYELDNQLAETNNDGYGNRQLADRSDVFQSLNPKLGLSYQWTEQSNVYGRVAQANRLPTASALYNLKSGDSGSLVGGVDEESSTTLELGYRYQQDNLRLSLALYRMSIDDAIVTARDTQGDTYRTNAGETLHQGFEAEVAYQISSELSAQLAYSYSRHTFEDYVNDGTVYSGNEMMRAPRTKAAATLTWKPVAISGLTTQLQADYFGEYWMDDENTRKADSYTLLHLKGEYAVAPGLTLYGRIENLLDEKYAYQQEVSWGRAKFYPGNERTLKAGLRYQW